MLVAVSAGLVAGISTQMLWPVLPPLLPLLCFALLLAVCQRFVERNWRLAALSATGCALGMLLAVLHANAVIDARLPESVEGSDFILKARILALAQQGDGSQLLQVSVAELPWQPASTSTSLFPAWLLPMPDFRMRISSREPVAALPGEIWQLPVRLRRPRASSNPGGADFERYLLGERVVATGYLREDNALQRLAAASGLMHWRSELLTHALPLLGDGPGDIADNDAERFARAVLPALVLDERSLLSSSQWRVLADTGTAHLVAISGLHVALLWGALIGIGSVLLRRRSQALKYRAAVVLPALLLAALYAALAGMPLPAARATLMLSVASAFLLVAARVPAWRVLLASAVVALVVDPLSVHASGFWLSFGAVGLLLLLNDLRWREAGAVEATHGAPSRFASVLAAAKAGTKMQFALSILVAPLLVGLFGAASVSSVLANLPAIPLVNLLALPPALAGFLLAPFWPGLANLLLDFATATMTGLWWLLVWIDGFSLLAPLQAFSASALQVMLLMLLLPLLLFVRTWMLRAALLLAVCLAWPVTESLPAGVARVCVLDVGQGLAVLARGARHAVLYDTGPAWGERDAGASVVVPAARALGARQLDVLVLSHNDSDHAGGAVSVQKALRPRAVMLGDPRSPQRVAGAHCASVRRWAFDGVQYTLYPGAPAGNDNDRSCVLHIAAGDQSLLVTGDSSRRRELLLLENYGTALSASVLVAGHHGSRTASAPTFLYRIAPQHVIFSTGYRNRFGHPHAQVTAQVKRQGATMHDTAEAGAVCLRLGDAGPVQPAGWRRESRRFWRE